MSINRKLISSVMTRKVCQVGVHHTACDALALMRKHSVSSVLVIENDLILGIITERDFVRNLHNKGKLKTLSCVDLMHSPVITVGAKASCLDAYHLMASRGIRHIAVTDEVGHVLGIASEGDVMRNFGMEYYTNFKDVASVMSADFCRLPPTATVSEALAEMVSKHQSCVVVVDIKGLPIGILTERDVVRLCQEEAHPERLALKTVMRSPVLTAKPRKRLHTAVKSMEEARIRRLVVVDDRGVACGLLTHHEVARGLEGDYVQYLKDVLEIQAKSLQSAAKTIDEKLLLSNILRSVTGTAVLASDLDFRISYATPSVKEVLGLELPDIGGADLRDTLKRVGWKAAAMSLNEEVVAKGARHYVVDIGGGKTDFQVSVLLDSQHDPSGYLVMAQRA